MIHSVECSSRESRRPLRSNEPGHHYNTGTHVYTCYSCVLYKIIENGNVSVKIDSLNDKDSVHANDNELAVRWLLFIWFVTATAASV